MYTYVPTPIYIPLISTDTQPYTGPMWIPVLIMVFFYVALVSFWVTLLRAILRGESDIDDMAIFIIVTLMLIFFMLLPFL